MMNSPSPVSVKNNDVNAYIILCNNSLHLLNHNDVYMCKFENVKNLQSDCVHKNNARWITAIPVLNCVESANKLQPTQITACQQNKFYCYILTYSTTRIIA